LMATHTYDKVLELPDMVARRAGRISANEEERMRRGYDIRPYFRIGQRTTRGTLAAAGEALAEMIYARQGELQLVDHGARTAQEMGFRYCEKCRQWISGDQNEQQHMDAAGRNACPAGGEPGDVHREVLLYTRGMHDFLLLEVRVPEGTAEERFGWSLLYALSNGFEVAFSADESEIGGYVYPVPQDPSR